MRCVDLYNQAQSKWFEEMVTTTLVSVRTRVSVSHRERAQEALERDVGSHEDAGVEVAVEVVIRSTLPPRSRPPL